MSARGGDIAGRPEGGGRSGSLGGPESNEGGKLGGGLCVHVHKNINTITIMYVKMPTCLVV